MVWWLWMVIGCGLLVLEMVAPGGFIFLFFGVGAFITGAIVATGLVVADSGQWILFSASSVVFLAVFRGKLKAFFDSKNTPTKDLNGLVGAAGSVAHAIGPGEIGQVEVRGANWSARNSSSQKLAPGSRFVVERVEGLTLVIKPE